MARAERTVGSVTQCDGERQGGTRCHMLCGPEEENGLFSGWDWEAFGNF